MKSRQVVFLFALVTSATALCYYPNAEPTTDAPCYPAAGHSFCCPAGYECADNKVCVSPDQQVYLRGSCSDLGWTSPACPQFCLYSADPSQDRSQNMQFCGKNATSAFFCCDGTDGIQCNCSDSQGLFALTGLDIYGQIVLKASGTATTGSMSMFTQIQSLTVSAPITAVAVSSSVSSVPSTSPLPRPPPATRGTGLSTAAKAGIGVAAAVGTLLLLAIVILALKVNRQHRRILELQEPLKPARARHAGEDPAHANVLDKAELLGTTPAPVSEADPAPASGSTQPPAAVTQQDAPVMVESEGYELSGARSVQGAREPEVSELPELPALDRI